MPRQATQQIADVLRAGRIAVAGVRVSPTPEVEEDEITLTHQCHVQVNSQGDADLSRHRSAGGTIATLFTTTSVGALVREITAACPALLAGRRRP